MKKFIIGLVVVLIVAALVVGGMYLMNNKDTDNNENSVNTVNNEVANTTVDTPEVSNLTVATAEDLTKLVDDIYLDLGMELPALQTQVLTLDAENTSEYFTGLKSDENIELVAVSEPMMSSQAYSLVLVKVKEGADVEAMAKEMNDNINMRKWICVEAEKVYTTSSGNVICMVMTNEATAKTIYEKFKTLAGGIGQEYERAAEVVEMPQDMPAAY